MDIALVIAGGFLGIVLGSFAGAQVWRLRARQLVADKKMGEKVDTKELARLKPLLGKKLQDDRSQCLSCGHTLRWYDLLPIVSWISLRGKCRYCTQPIGWTEFLLELTLGLTFALSVLLWPASLFEPLELIKLGLWLVALVALAINFVYDARWMLLVPALNWLLIGCGIVFSIITVLQSPDVMSATWSLLGAVLILGGLYAMLWVVSRGRWVGDGDMYIGTGLALFLGDWKLAFVALFMANVIGTLVVAPGLLSGKLARGSQVPFGPLLIIGGVLTWFLGDAIINWYQSLLFI